jgi:acyl dehydratase
MSAPRTGPRTIEDVREGQELPQVVVERLTRTDLVRYAGASGDFNPIHHDEEFAKSAGNPTVFGHGMLTAGFVARCISDFVGPENLRRYRVRFATRVWPGDTITCRGKVLKVYDEDGEPRIDGEVSATTQKGEVAVSGTFTATLPRRS